MLTRPYWGLAKLGATPAWLFLCSAFTIIAFMVIYWMVDVYGRDAVIRSEHGTKQIIYRADKGLAATINPTLTRKLMYLKKRAEWFEAHDQDFSIMTDLWNIHVVLHETLGHER